MTIKEAQEAVDTWIKTYGVRYFSELTNMACLTEEVGELARIMGVFAKLNINVEYSYSLVSTYIAISVKDLTAAEEALKEEAVELIDQAQLTALVDLDRSNAQEGR